MATVIIYSIPYDVFIVLSKDQLVERFPTSLLAGIVEQDPEVEHINLENKFVTPEVLNLLQKIVTTSRINYGKYDMTEAGRYLLMPILEVISDPKYHVMPGRYNNIPLDDAKLKKDFPYYFAYALNSNFDALVRYMIERVPFILNQKELELPLAMTIYSNKPQYYRLLRSYVDDPEDIVITLPELLVGYPNADMVIKKQSFTLPELAILTEANEILAMMVNDNAFSSYDWVHAYNLANEIGNMEAVQIILPIL